MGTKCGACGKPLGSFETIHVAGEGPRFGRMLMTFEGFTLDARIKDTIEVLGEEDSN